MSHDQVVRAASFRDELFLWLTVRHFLSADLLRELCSAAVGFGADGDFALDDLFDSVVTEGSDALVAWALMPRSVHGDLARRLQDLVRAIAWQGDSTRSDDVTSKSDDFERLRLLWWAVDAGRFDLTSIDGSTRRGAPPESIASLFVAMNAIAQSIDDEQPVEQSPTLETLANRPFPLNAVLIKHTGDLCIDADDWRKASALYRLAEQLLRDGEGREWGVFTRTFHTILKQSQANVLRQLEGPRAALQVLSGARSASFAEDPTSYINAGIDLSSATWASRSDGMGGDHRAVVVTAPQLSPIQRHLGYAYERLADGRYPDAYRWFWAGLRRQTALGSHVLSAEAKAAFGLGLIEQFADERAPASTAEEFWLGVRLMIEGGTPRVVERARWSEDVVAKYVDEPLIARALAHSQRPPSAVYARSLVLLELFSRWSRLLPRERPVAARAMLMALVQFATPKSSPIGAEKELILKSQKALRLIAKNKPSFKGLIGEQIVDLTLAWVRDGAHFFTTEMLTVTLEFIDSLAAGPLRVLVEGLLTHVETLNLADVDFRYNNLILGVLESAAARKLRKTDPALSDRIDRFEIDIALGQRTEPRNLFFLLRRLPKALVDERIDDASIAGLVEQTRTRALQINSSDATEHIIALLSAPELAGPVAIRDALAAFKNILRSALDSDPAISFGSAYSVLTQLGNPLEPISQSLAEKGSVAADEIDEIWGLLLSVWARAPETPEMFNGFMLPPPTEPDPVYVHNWAFASSQLAQRLSRISGLDQALDTASENAMLRRPITVARSIAATPRELQGISPALIDQEGGDAFYAALGQRLAVLAGSGASNRGDLVRALLHGALRHGPNGMDAAVFTAALEDGVAPSLSISDVAEYGERLEANKSLRLGLSALYYAIAKFEDDD